MAGPYKVFLSAVTSEFGVIRDRIAADLRSRGLLVSVQSDFRARPGVDTLLDLLHNHIHECDAVVCIIGKESGRSPETNDANRYAHILPSDITEASYTRWELFLGRHYKKQMFYFLAAEAMPENWPAPAAPDGQYAYVQHLKQLGVHRVPFAHPSDLRAEVMCIAWPLYTQERPIVLPYPSLGGLSRGVSNSSRIYA